MYKTDFYDQHNGPMDAVKQVMVMSAIDPDMTHPNQISIDIPSLNPIQGKNSTTIIKRIPLTTCTVLCGNGILQQLLTNIKQLWDGLRLVKPSY